MYRYICRYIFIDICICKCRYICIDICICICRYICMQLQLCTYVYMYIMHAQSTRWPSICVAGAIYMYSPYLVAAMHVYCVYIARAIYM